MTRIHVLSPGFTNPNNIAFLFPLFKFKKALRAVGYDLRVFYHTAANIAACDVLLIESKAFKDKWGQADFKNTLEYINRLNTQTKVIWCDQADSSGTFQGHVLPHVYRYAKAQVLKDLRVYTQKPYGGRVYTDFYHRQFGAVDENPYIHYPAIDSADLKKIRISWNSGMMHYGFLRPYTMKFWPYIPFQNIINFSKPLAAAEADRLHDISCRMGISYKRASVSYQRQRLREILSVHMPTGKLTHTAYLRELCYSKICISPFGFGEITLKDFETFLCGAALLKPDMSHMRTWPDVFEKDVTYLSHEWDLTDVHDKIQAILKDHDKRIAIAKAGQDRYLEHTTGPQAAFLFTRQFGSILSED